jgi:hypothetical protein
MIRLKNILLEQSDNDWIPVLDGVEQRAVEAARYLVSQGIDPLYAAAFMGNFAVESGVRIDASQYYAKTVNNKFSIKPTTPKEADKTPGWAGYGIAQWTQSRRSALIAAGADTLEAQLDYLISELEGSESRAWRLIQKETTLSGAITSIVKNYERAGVPHLGRRLSQGESIYKQIKDLTPETAAGMPELTQDDIKLYPNPVLAGNEITIEIINKEKLPIPEIHIDIYSIDGKKVDSHNWNDIRQGILQFNAPAEKLDTYFANLYIIKFREYPDLKLKFMVS